MVITFVLCLALGISLLTAAAEDCSSSPPFHLSQYATPGLCSDPSSVYNVSHLLVNNWTAPVEAVARGLQSSGNMARLQRIARKVLTGETVSFGVAGGSVSAGVGDPLYDGHALGCVAIRPLALA